MKDSGEKLVVCGHSKRLKTVLEATRVSLETPIMNHDDVIASESLRRLTHKPLMKFRNKLEGTSQTNERYSSSVIVNQHYSSTSLRTSKCHEVSALHGGSRYR
jgi:hypothetical protein